MGKFIACSPSPGDCGELCDPQRHSYNIFLLGWTKWLSQNFVPVTWGKMSVGGGLVAVQFFWSLKNDTKTFNLHFNEPSRNILGPLGRYDHLWEKTPNKTNKCKSVIFLLAKNSTFLHIGAWNIESHVHWYAESDGVVFVKVLWLSGFFPFFENKANFVGLVTSNVPIGIHNSVF